MNFKFQISNFKYKNQRGFTLIELLVVIVIIGILATFLMTNFSGVRARARDAQRKSDIKQIQAALEMYRADNGGYPTVAIGCNVALSSPSSPTTIYLPKIPCDPSSGGLTAYNSSFTNTFSTIISGVSYTFAKNYCLRTCLENTNDSQHTPSDSCPVSTNCPDTNANYTVVNP